MPPKAEGEQRAILIRLPASLHEALKGKATVKERTVSWVVRDALRKYVSR